MAPQRAIDQRHRHRLALRMPEGQPVPASELRWRRRRALELVHHLTFGQGDLADRDRKPELLGHELDLDLAYPDLAGEGMVPSVATLGRVAEDRKSTRLNSSRLGISYA